MGKTKYLTEEERKEARRNAVRKYRITHPIRRRAQEIVQNYNQEDKKYNRGKGDLTSQWIVKNIFSKPCVHCGKTGWKIIGCNRLDNSRPHTMDNVEPCCEECNHKLALPYLSDINSQPLDQIDKLSGEVICTYSSANVAAIQNNFVAGRIRDCCNGGYFDNRRNKWVNCNTYKGFVWKRHLM